MHAREACNDESTAANTLAEFLVNMSASADVLAMAKVEVELDSIPEGKNVSSHGNECHFTRR